MTKIGEKLAAVLLAAAMIVTFMPVVGTQTAYAANFPAEITVGYRDSGGNVHNVRLSSEKPGFINGNPEAQVLPVGESPVNVFNAYFDIGRHALMLKDYQGVSFDERSGSGDLTIVLFGNSTIDSKGNNAVYLPGNVEITSQHHGKLTIVNQPTGMSSFGIRTNSDCDVTISGSAVLDITATIQSDSSTDTPHGIYAGGDVTIKDSAKVSVHCSASQDHVTVWPIYAGTSLNISTNNPIEVTSESTGAGGTVYGLFSNANEISISNVPYIKMDLTGQNRKPYPFESTLGALLENIDYFMASEVSGQNTVYTIAPKEFVPETVNIQLDRTNLERLTPDLTGSDVAAYFFPSIGSPHGATCPAETPEGWYIRMGDNTGFGDDMGDPRNMEGSTESLEWGEPYFFSFEVLTDPGHKWNPEQGFTINGSDDAAVEAYTSDGKPVYKVSLMLVCEENLNKAQMGEVPDAVYSGSAYTPEPTLTFNGETLAKNDHYFISYEDSNGNAVPSPTNAGSYQLIATGDYAFFGTLCADFVITPAVITPTVTLSKKTYTYDGKAKKPAVTVKDGSTKLAASNYTVTYKNNKNVGEASAVVKLKGNYTGSKTVTFKINPKGTSLSKVTAAKKAATVKWKKQSLKMSSSRITGYQIQLAANSKFTKSKKTVTVKGYSKTSRKVTGLKGGKKYWVKIRTYKTENGTKYYSPWSKVKTVKTKK